MENYTDQDDELTYRRKKKQIVFNVEDEEEEEPEEVPVLSKNYKSRKDNQTLSAIGLPKLSKNISAGRIANTQTKAIQSDLEFIQEKKVICTQIKLDYQNMDQKALLSLATQNQVVYSLSEGTKIDYKDMDQIKQYIMDNSFNYNEIENLVFLAKGGQSQVVRLEVKQPVELIAKMVLPSIDKAKENIADILMESHYIKLLPNKEFIVEILEEIIEYNPAQDQIYNYIALVEQAQRDLKQIVSIWKSPALAMEEQEYFSEEKLFYILFKATSALAYIHSQNVYYGDMKESNLLIFRDYSIKIGDFGVSIKLKEPSSDSECEDYELKGITPGYVTPQINSYFTSNERIERKYLIENDCFALWQTFDNVFQEMKEQISYSSYFTLLLDDIKNKIPLKDLVDKYSQILQENDSIIFKLCDQFIDEEKIFAIPNILSLHKHGFIVNKVKEYFFSREIREFQFLNPTQKTLLEEDKTFFQKKQALTQKDVIPQIQDYIRAHHDFFAEMAPLVKRLIHYKLSLMPLSYFKFYRQTFGDFYKLPIGNKIIDLKSLLTVNNNELTSISTQFKPQFDLFAIFYASTYFDYVRNFKPLEILIKVYNEQQDIAMEFDCILLYLHQVCEQDGFYTYIDTYRKRLVELCTLQPCQKFKEGLASAILIQALNYPYSFNAVRIYEIENIVASLEQLDVFEKITFKSIYSYLFNAYARVNAQGTKKKIEYQLKSRKIHQKVFGQLGNKMSENGFNLYQEYRKLFETSKEDDDYSWSFDFLLKATNYSLQEQRLKYLVHLCNEYYLKKDPKLEKVLEIYRSIDETYFAILSSHFDSPQSEELNQRVLTKLLDYEYFFKLQKILKSNDMFKIGLAKLTDHLELQDKPLKRIYLSWLNEQNQKQIQDYLTNKSYIAHQQVSIEIGDIKYEGEVENNQLNGKGTLTFNDGRVIEGSFQNNLWHGLIKQRFPDSITYEEEYQNGLKNGKSIRTFSSGMKIEGQYVDDKESGDFNINWPNGDYYKGGCLDDQPHGYGIYVFADKKNYTGEFKNGKCHGKGVYLFSNGNRYEGDFKDGNRHGKCVYTYFNGDSYQGDYVDDKQHGYGIYVQQQYGRYEGYFRNDQKEGKGTYYYKTGDKYEGDYKDDVKCGRGVYYTARGNQYEGDFFNDKKHGKGVLNYKKTGNRYEGDYYNDVKQGKGVFYYANGNRYIGPYENDKQCGKGVYIYKSGKRYEGEFKNDKMDGKGFEIDRNGIKKECTYQDGQKV